MSSRKPPCKFFQQGKCRNGNRCQFPHVYENNNTGNSFGSSNGGLKSDVDKFANGDHLDSRDKELKDTLDTVNEIEVGILTSSMGFGYPATENLITGRDYSFEESRWDYYQARQQNAIPQYEQQLQVRAQDMKMCIDELKRDSRKAARYSQMAAKQKLSNPSQVIKPFLSRPLDLTGSNLQNATPYGNTSNAFGTQGSSPFASNPFGAQTSNASPFGSSTTKAPTSGAFGTQSFGSSAFGSTPATSAFGSAPLSGTASNSAFGSSGFGSASLGSTSTPSAFGNSSFGSTGATTSAFGTSAPTNTNSAFGSSGFGSKPAASAFGSSTFGSTPSASSPFASLSNPSQTPATTSPFGQASQASQASTSPFGQALQAPTTSPFGQASTTATSPFGQTPASTTSPFGQASTASAFGQSSTTSAFGQTSTPFGQSATATPAFGSTAFGQAAPATASPFGSAFGQSSTPFGQTTAPFGSAPKPTGNFQPSLKQSDKEPERIKSEELSDVVLEQFKDDKFTLGMVPEIEPPLIFC